MLPDWYTHLCCSFRAGEVDHEEACEADLLQDVSTPALLLDGDLQHCMRARWRLIGSCWLLGALLVALHQQLHDLKTHTQSSPSCVWMSRRERTGSHAHLASRSNLLCIDGRHFCDASNLNHSFGVFSEVQEAWWRVQQVTDHLIVDLKWPKCQQREHKSTK